MTPEVTALLEKYVDRGWKLVPIPKGSKAPSGKGAKGWQTRHITDPKAIGEGNVGILLGEPSAWLIDIDLDWLEAGDLAEYFLPPTGLIFGRPGKPDSHWLYTVSQARTRKFQIGKKDEGGMIVELRSTGAQTVFPPSVHPSGDTISWTDFQTPATISFEELDKACGRLAAACVVLRNWTDGSRQDIAFGLSGMMLKAEWPEDEVEHFIRVAAEQAGDDEVDKRVQSVKRTARNLEDSSEVSGYTGLVDIWGEDVAKRVAIFLKISADEEVPPGAILITNSPSKELAKVAWRRISEGEAEGQPTLFTFGETVARIDSKQIQPLTKDGFWQELADRTDWVRKENKKIVWCDPPPNPVTYMRNQRKTEIPLPPLSGSTTTPIMSSNGEIHVTPGYDPDSQFYLFPTVEVPTIHAKPKKAELKKAVDLIEEVLVDFPFVHKSDKAHAIAMMILPFVRPMISGPTPLHLLDKPVQGTGATLLAEAATAIKTGEALAAQSAPRTEEEWQKVILSKLITAPEFLFLDNVRTIYSDTLAIALTASEYEGRRLGVSEMVKVPIQCTWIMTGNNVEMSGDFPRRICQIRLDANVEDPTDRGGFLHPDLHGWIREERGALVWAILTVSRAWIAAGSPEPSVTLASYTSWAHTIGGILETMGIPGFLETPEERKRNIDPFIEAQADFIRCWLYHGIKDTMNLTLRSSELLNMCDACDLGFGSASNGKGDLNSMTFSSRRMSKIADRVFEITLMDESKASVKVKRDKYRGNAAWTLEPISDLSELDIDQIWHGENWT